MGLKDTHGGVKRSLQIQELLDKYECVSLNPYFSLRKSIKFLVLSPKESLKIIFFSIYIFFRKGVSIKGVTLFILKTPFLIHIIKKYKNSECIFEGGTTLSLLIMYYFAFLGLTYHVFPQNIEFIAPKAKPDNYFRSNCYKYNLEIESYKSAKSVSTVSSFDKAILECHQIKSFLLESFPIKSNYKILRSIALKRKKLINKKNSRKKNILLIGTISNHPTREGLIKIINYLNTKKLPYNINLVGYGTSEFSKFASEKINVLGAVTESKLEELMVNTHCLVINTIQTSGYLFKVVEFNLSEIPIIFTSNFIQHMNLEEYGIFHSDLNNLQNIIEEIKPTSKFKKFKKPIISWL